MANKKPTPQPQIMEDEVFDDPLFDLAEEDRFNEMLSTINDVTKHQLTAAVDLTKFIHGNSESGHKAKDVLKTLELVMETLHESSPVHQLLTQVYEEA